MRNKFDEQLELLNRELIAMGALCERSLEIISDILQTGDLARTDEVIAAEEEIDQKERDIEQLCLKLLLQQQPVARDLRLISAALKMITDMERIGDQTQDIAEILNVGNVINSDRNLTLAQMAQATMKMVTGSVDAYVRKELELAEDVICYDDVVDKLFSEEREVLIANIASNPQNGEMALDQLMVAKYFERIGDHAVNIAKWVKFSITGTHERGIE